MVKSGRPSCKQSHPAALYLKDSWGWILWHNYPLLSLQGIMPDLPSSPEEIVPSIMSDLMWGTRSTLGMVMQLSMALSLGVFWGACRDDNSWRKRRACRFENLKVPREALLDRYANVSPEGKYSSPISTVSARFGTMVSLSFEISESRFRWTCLSKGSESLPHSL